MRKKKKDEMLQSDNATQNGCTVSSANTEAYLLA
jgi:hypothetical protein